MTITEIISTKIPANAETRMQAMANNILLYKGNGQKNACRDETMKLYGFLNCLEITGRIAQSDARRLYLYYKGISHPF